MSLVIGIDTSTTATKAILVDSAGRALGVGMSSYDFASPHPLWTEQDPHLWWDATVASIRQVLSATGVEPGEVSAIGLTGQMHGSVLLDTEGEVVRPAILWNDQRTEAECEEIRRRVGRDRFITITGNDALTGFTAPKLLWVAHHEPQVWRRVNTVLLPKDYVRYRLTDELAVDVADGSGTALFDLARRTWSKEILAALDIEPSLFPPTFEGPAITGYITGDAAAATGLRTGIPVVAGGGDQSANAVGLGAVSPGVVALSLGTSGVVFATTDGPLIEPDGRVHSFCHAVPGKWHMMGVMLSAAGSLRWLRDAIAPSKSFDEMTSMAAKVPAGADGLLFLPYLTGERTPHPDPHARGAFVGLTIRHHLGHLARAVLEGVAFGLRDGLDLMTSTGLAFPTEIRASGGGTRSALWRQIIADVLESRIVTVSTEEGAAYGAAILGAVGAGWFTSVEEACDALLRVQPAEEPSTRAGIYREAHSQYVGLYPALSATFNSFRNTGL